MGQVVGELASADDAMRASMDPGTREVIRSVTVEVPSPPSLMRCSWCHPVRRKGWFTQVSAKLRPCAKPAGSWRATQLRPPGRSKVVVPSRRLLASERRRMPPRVWLGYQSDGAPVAYFENRNEAEVSFSVSQVISVQGTRVEEEEVLGPAIPAVKMTCHDRKLDRVFCAFIDEVRERIVRGAGALEVIQMSASEWRSLLQVASAPLSENTAAGIFGELRFLESAVIELGANAVEMWQRSPQEVHDFIGPHARVEVKASTFQTRSAVTVHGLHQLELPVTGTLTLAVVEVQRHGSESIDDVVARLRESGVGGEILTEKLRDSGYVIGMPGSEESLVRSPFLSAFGRSRQTQLC